MEAQPRAGPDAHQAWQQDEPRRPEGSADVSREAVLSHTGEVFDALQQKVKELHAQLDGTLNGGGGGGGGGGFDSPTRPDLLAAHEHDEAGAEEPVTPDGQSVPRLSTGVYSPEMEQCVRQSVAELEAKLEGVLEGVADDLAAEVSREQQHLLLMQSQVDKQGQTLLREVAALQGRLDQERTQRTFVQSAVRDSRDELSIKLQQQAQELSALRGRLAQLETPWLVRLLGSLSSLVWGPCGAAAPAVRPAGGGGGGAISSAAAAGSYEAMPGAPAAAAAHHHHHHQQQQHVAPSQPARMAA